MKRKPIHTAKFDRCVRSVKRRLQGVRDPFAVCMSALGPQAILKAHRRNPVSDPEHKALLKKLARHFEKDERALKRRR